MKTFGALLAVVILSALFFTAFQPTPVNVELLPKISPTLYLATTETQRAKGLSEFETLGENEGMLFVFEKVETQCMWNKNIGYPVDVAFLDQDSRVLNIESMGARSEEAHCSFSPAKYAIEMNSGWFNKNWRFK